MKYFATSIFVLFVITLNAQKDTVKVDNGLKTKKELEYNREKLPEKGDFGVGFDVSGIFKDLTLGAFNDGLGNPSLSFKYFKEDDVALTFGLGLNSMNSKTQSTDSVFIGGALSLVELDSSSTRTDVFFRPGIEKHFYGKSNIDAYVGGSVEISVLGKTKIKSEKVITDPDTVNSQTIKFDYLQDGGIMLGLNAHVGFNYFIAKKLSLGAEYKFGYASSRIGGDWTSVTNIQPVKGSATNLNEQGAVLETANNFQFNGAAAIRLTYYFDIKR